MNSYPLTIPVTQEHSEAVTDALDYLRERLIGQVPAVFTEYAHHVGEALWEGWSRDNVALRLVANNGEPLTSEIDDAEADAENEAWLNSEEAGRINEELTRITAWEQSPEGRAEMSLAQQRDEYIASRALETKQLYAAWLEEYAEQFALACRGWRAARQLELDEDFAASL